ncbi:hypothetical protein GQ600_20229 [Phytophthora cactorum]|nr:hypothetical protein GQ600_20229 [Phytophthora cactorum]
MVTTVSELRKAGAKKKRILKCVHDNSACNPCNQDVHNLNVVLTEQAHVLDLTAIECLTYETMQLVLTKGFGADPNVVIFDAGTLGVVVDGIVLADKPTIRSNMAGLSNELVLFPVDCNGSTGAPF